MYIQHGGLIFLKTKNDFERKNITFRLNYIYVLSFWKHIQKKYTKKQNQLRSD